MKAILRDQKGWTKTMTIPYPMPQIRLPLHRKLRNVFEVYEGSYVSTERTVDVVVFELVQRGLNKDTLYYDEVVYGGASSRVSSPYDESQAGATPATAHQCNREE